MEERILIPLDGTEAGEAVLPKVEDLIFKTSPRLDAKITLLKVISRMNFNMLTDDDRAQLPIPEDEAAVLTREAGDYLELVAGKLRKKGMDVKTMVTFGHEADEIVKAARATRAHLIAMSAPHHSGVIRWAIGSVSDKVMRLEGNIPVLAVNPSDKKKSAAKPMDSLQGMMKQA
ncbi:MAG: universal stress protein [Dehalococcoidales bacterium]|nr:universal stress protein [Dehalococcoidales bacterium]